jgi:tetratricopeptide (TPR) repeat protein
MVHQRLLKTILKKNEMMDIFKAIQAKDFTKVITACDEKINMDGNLVLSCLKIKGKFLIKLERYEEAFKLYDELLASKKLPWVLMGRGQCNYFFKKYPEALADFEAIVELSDVNVEGYDWIAKAKLAMNDKSGAQETLENAARLSPKAILRQQILGDVAYGNKNLDVAEKAYKWAVQLGKYSCYRRILDYINYAEILLNKAKSDDGRVSLRAGTEAVTVLEGLMAFYNNDRLVRAQANIMLVFAYHSINKTDKAKILAKKTADSIEKDHLKLDKQWLAKLGEAFITVGEKEKGQALIDNNTSDSTGSQPT